MTPGGGLIEQLEAHARRAPDTCAIATPTEHLDYAALRDAVANCADHLARRGMQAGAVVGIRCADEVAHLTLSLALFRLGAAQFTLPAHAADAANRALAERLRATHLVSEADVTDAAQAPMVADAATPAAEARLYLTTSGTTGTPKIVVLTDADIVAQAPRHIGGAGERFACLAHLDHNFAKRHRLYCVARGATNVFITAAPDTVVDACLSLDVQVMHVSAFQARELLAARDAERLGGIRLKLGGSHVPMALRAQLLQRITADVHTGYGTTETGAIAFAGPDDHDDLESVGNPLDGIELTIVDDTLTPLPGGQRGEILIGCRGLFREYLDQPDLSRQRRTGAGFRTGDIGYLDPGGRLVVCGRADDMFVFNSMNIHPQEIEAQICQHPGVVDAAVLPRPSAVHGDIPVALIQPGPDGPPDPRALRDFVHQRVGLRCPRQFIVVDAIPRNAAGKVLRAQASAHLGLP